ncbi:hypothetical protein [uncultured Corynebacterium sp.]|mgnify:CR=1 FL=1|uniref:DUF7426 family protein n=1 Tax=uncultured Corynebacterium sp. TaxID=159447 RepID=UPI0026323D95|nr:hypothetical protein [uncultured Corynebacterium sp.]
MRELRDFYNPNMTASINGTEYEVPAPSAREGLRLHALFADPEKAANAKELDEIHHLFGGTGYEESLPVGGLWDTLWDDGVTWGEAMHLGMTALVYYGIGEKAAISYWESAGKGLTADPVRATAETEPTGPTPANMPKKRKRS